MRLIVFCVLLPLLAANDECNDSAKFKPFLDGGFYKKCRFDPVTGAHVVIVGCESTFNKGVMLPVGEEKREVFPDAPGYEERCLLKNGVVSYSSDLLKSSKQNNIDQSCEGFTTGFDRGNVRYMCRYEGEKAVLEVLGCRFPVEQRLKFPITEPEPFVPIDRTNVVLGKEYKCVLDGDSAKLIEGEVKLCENRDGETIPDGSVYKKCILEGNIYRTEVVGCVSIKRVHGVAINKVLIGEVSDDEDGKAFKCVRAGDSAKLVGGEFERCERSTGRLIEDGPVYKQCILEDNIYRTEVAGCVLGDGDRFSKRLLIRHVALGEVARKKQDGSMVKCVKDGDSAKLIFGEFKLCENKEGETITDRSVYKKCILEGNVYKTEVLGCVSLKGKEIVPLEEYTKDKDEKLYKCVRDGNSEAKYVGGELALCELRMGKPVVTGPVYRKCIFENNTYRSEVEGCILGLSNTKPGFAVDSVALGAVVQKDDGSVVKCVKDGNSAKLVGGNIQECDNRGDQEFIVGDVYKRCIVEEGYIYRTEVVGCVGTIQGAFSKFFEKVRVDGVVTYNIRGNKGQMKCVKSGDTAVVIKGDLKTCENRTEGVEFAHGTLFKVCTIEDGYYKSKVVGCASSYQGVKLVFSAYAKVLGKYEYCEKKGDSAILYTGEEAKRIAEKKRAAKNETETRPPAGIQTEAYLYSIFRGNECYDATLDKVYSFNGLVYQCTMEDGIIIDKPVGCIPFSPLYNDDSYLAFGTKKEIKKGLYQTCGVPSQTSVRVAIETQNGTEKYDSTAIRLETPKCKPFEVDNAVVHYSRFGDLPVGTEARLTCNKGFVIPGRLLAYKNFNCDGKRGWVEQITGDKMSDEKCLRGTFNESQPTSEIHECPVIPEIENAEIYYHCHGHISENCIAQINCKNGLVIKRKKISDYRFFDKFDRIRCNAEKGWLHSSNGGNPYEPFQKCVSPPSQELSIGTNCPPMPAVENGVVSYSSVGDLPENVVAEIACKEGFILDNDQPHKKYICSNKLEWIDESDGRKLAYSSMDKCVPKRYPIYYDQVKVMRTLDRACYFNGRQINLNASVFVNDFVFTCAEGRDNRLELQFAGCFTNGTPANVAERFRSRNIAQCDFTKLNKESEMLIVNV